MSKKYLWAFGAVVLSCLLAAPLFAQPSGSVTQGPGTTTIADMMPNCPSNHKTPLGSITSGDGKTWVVPADNHFQTAPKLADLHNTCKGLTPANLAAANLSNVPITDIDPGGEVITGYLFSDNYFELYINGVLVGVDAVPFTPFNSSVVRFRVSKPYTIAVQLVDWEENPGLGSEINNGNNYHPGDGGFIAQFSDGTVTDATWKAQVFYIAPIQNLNDVVEKPDGTRSTATATLAPTCNANCYGVHYPVPTDWMARSFNESGWVNASLYTAAQVTNQAAFKNFETTAWPNARFIWTSNLVLDNVVLVRKTVGTSGAADIAGEADFEVFPNPVSENISLKINNLKETGLFDVQVYDARGISVFQQKKVESALDIQGLTRGVYFLKIGFAKGEICRKVVVE